MEQHSGAALVLAADIGGTNTNCAIMDGTRALFARRYPSGHTVNAEETLLHFLSEAAAAGCPRPILACVCAAGPVRNGTIAMSNTAWVLTKAGLEKALGMRCFLLNDFSAVAWGILSVPPGRSQAVTALAMPDGTMPKPDARGLIVALGAGTGLGCGFITQDGDGPRVYPSEGGHINLPVYNEDSARLSAFLATRYESPIGAEAAVSGLGLGAILAWLASEAPKPGELVCQILKAKANEQARLISDAAVSDTVCALAMGMFVDLYARVASSIALAFLPYGGLYLAGGIAAKNAGWFIEGNRFMRGFLASYKEHTRAILERTPVFILNNYDISLSGAALAASVLSQRELT